ncbi:MAG TPA: hypothetical protein VF013_00940 [Candidatus Limnocylindria bacterium]
MSSRLRAAPALAVALLLAACVPAVNLPDDCDDAAVTRQATLADNKLDPATIEVCRDQHVTIEYTIEQDGVLHMHGYDDQVDATEVHAGDVIELEFDATHPGQFPIEVHTTEDAEADAGTFIVHER